MSRVRVIVLLALVGVCIGRVIPDDEHPLHPSNEWEGRIVGGSTASVGQFPHQVSLRTAAGSHFCGASIVNTRWVVSAAHCTMPPNVSGTRIVVGAHSRTSGGTTHNCARIVNHPSYNANTIRNDVSVLQLVTTITYSSTVRAIPLSTANTQTVSAQVSGWGRTATNGPLAANLLFVNKQTMTNAVCQSRLSVGVRQMVFADTLCAGGVSGQAVCNGDSGGPLITAGQLIGIVSWGIDPCGFAGAPDMYARVSSYRAWILGQTG